MGDRAPASEENGVPRSSLLEARADEQRSAGNGRYDRVRVPEFAHAQLPRIMEWIREGRYKPAPVKRVWIPKPDGTERPLGVPTVLDRVIQQAMAQVLGPLFEVDFNESSFGFRYGRRAQAAVERIGEAAEQGYRWGVDCDLKSYWSSGSASFVSSLRSSER